MKIVLSLILTVAAVAQGKSTDRQLQNNNYYYGNGNGNGGQQNFEEYMKAQVSRRSFTFTGCSGHTNGAGYSSVYATYRLCDQCSSGSTQGCGNENGDYIVSMREFSETYGEYWEEVTYQDKDSSPFQCVRAEEYAENYYENQYNNNNGQQNNNQNQNNNNGQNNGQENEYYVGPHCVGGTTIKLGLFWDEDCIMPVNNGASLQNVLGFNPKTKIQPPKCIPCMMAQNNNNNNQNGNGEVELNPLCDRLLEESGRCDRTQETTEFDAFWHDVVSWVNKKYEQAENSFGSDNNQAQNNNNQAQNYNYGQNYQGQNYQGQNYQGQNYQGQNYQGQNYYGQNYQGQNYQGQNYYGNQQNNNQYGNGYTCNLIDSLPHAKSMMFKTQGRNLTKFAKTAISLLVLGVGAVLAFFAFNKCVQGQCKNPCHEPLLSKQHELTDDYETEYQRDADSQVKGPVI